MHGLSLAGILTWLNLPETREQLALRESAAYAHTRHVAALNMEHAVQTAASIVRDYNTSRPEREAQDRKTPGSAHRASVHARKAAWLLYRFSRITPVNEADLRHAAGCLPASAKRASGCDVEGPTSANSTAPPTPVPAAPLEQAHTNDPAPAHSAADTKHAQPVADAERADADQHESEFENQPTIVRRSTRASAPAPSPAPDAIPVESEVSEIEDFNDPAFADPLGGGSTHAGAALAATGPPHTG
jgi:hypothetical protein